MSAVTMKDKPQPGRTRTFASGLITGVILVTVGVVFNKVACVHKVDPAAPLLKVDMIGKKDACVKAAYPMTGPESAYHLMKALPPPAECKVQGFTIEELEPQMNFRRPWTLGYDPKIEGKMHVLPYMRGNQDISLRSRQRRVYLDLGGRSFDSSVEWFLHWYPLDFSEVHVFEAEPGLFVLPELSGWNFPELLTTVDKSSRVASWGKLPLPDWAVQRVHLHNKFVTVEDKPSGKGSVEQVNITRFILDELRLTKDDALIVKMDIEGAEWDVLPAWMAIRGMEEVVDEIWVEIHYKEATMARFHWMKWSHTREEAYELLTQMRKKGFFIHPWP